MKPDTLIILAAIAIAALYLRQQSTASASTSASSSSSLDSDLEDLDALEAAMQPPATAPATDQAIVPSPILSVPPAQGLTPAS